MRYRKITMREKKIAEYVADGYTNSQIGAAMGITTGTVNNMLNKIYKKLRISNRKMLSEIINKERDSNKYEEDDLKPEENR